MLGAAHGLHKGGEQSPPLILHNFHFVIPHRLVTLSALLGIRLRLEFTRVRKVAGTPQLRNIDVNSTYRKAV